MAWLPAYPLSSTQCGELFNPFRVGVRGISDPPVPPGAIHIEALRLQVLADKWLSVPAGPHVYSAFLRGNSGRSDNNKKYITLPD
ncbi:MAG TPA: hypothetical protein VKA68_17345 [bacterium]|nr:hypothetical protein [bacterium]